MTDYAIGDVQGCFQPLLRLLDKIQFNEKHDRLWFVGDLVNRGPQSLEVLRFVKNLPLKPHITLGNHDLYLLSKLFGNVETINKDDTLTAILTADDKEDLGHWLRQQSILYHNKKLNIVMCHAGIAPMWSLEAAKSYALELETTLKSESYHKFLQEMYGNEPSAWSSTLKNIPRLRCIANYFTRMRFCDNNGGLLLSFKGKPSQVSPGIFPWYAVPNRIPIAADIVFGHWSALEGASLIPTIHAIDTGCVWGGSLTALRLTDKKRFQVT